MAPSLIRKLGFITAKIVVSCVLCFLSCISYAAEPRYVRVLVTRDVSSLNIKTSGAYEISDYSKKKVFKRGKRLKTTAVAYKNGILIAGTSIPVNKIFIKTRNPDSVIINGKSFRGDIYLFKDNSNKLSVVNCIELEDYVKGISVREISHYWPPEVIKASVIVFRTFAIYKCQESVKADFDVTSDIYSQVYSGKAAERYRISKIVDETKGLVLEYKGKIFPAFYHATCGGHTEDVSMLWKINTVPLKGVACSFCKDSPHFKWHYVAALDEINNKLSESGQKFDGIKDIKILGRDKSGRITDLGITGEKNEARISAKDFRNIIGPNLIKSTNFKVSISGCDAVFQGVGWGHGVGLCQWGAYFMAKQGYNYEQILQHYYPGTDVKAF